MTRLSEVKTVLEESGQSHLLDFWDELGKEEQEVFLRQLQGIDFREVKEMFRRSQECLNEEVTKVDDKIQPIPSECFESTETVDPIKLEEYDRLGLKEISEGHVAVLLLAGGQGTRLGINYPKGMYSVGLPSGKTLFQIQAERIRRITGLAKQKTGKSGKVCWYIMTNSFTTDEIARFLKQHHYFGLNEKDVVLFEQGLLPAFNFEGKVLLERKGSVALSPDGNGGMYRALRSSGVLDDMRSRGVKYVHVHSVDNILVKVADPVFVGYCASKNADCGAKVVSKTSPEEAVGVICQIDGKFQVVEYSEITKETASRRAPSGKLMFDAGNICNHLFTTEFLERIAKEYETTMKLHVAKKKIPCINGKGDKLKPTEPNGIKLEKFIFDVFAYSERFVVLEVERDSEFSALKNADSAGKDCPSTARQALLSLHKRYIERAGGTVSCDEVEISPLLSYAGENLSEKVKGKTFNKKTVILSNEESTLMRDDTSGT